MEKLAATTLVGAAASFALAGVVSAYLPVAHLAQIEYQTLADIQPEPSLEWIQLSEQFPDAFKKHYGEPTAESFHKALRHARDQYIAEGCWHCHSQFIRPVSNEDQRYGAVSYAGEYMNEMFLPHLFGTRRVGPDLIREHAKHSNDWHVAHFLNPKNVVPASVMPIYPWFFDGETPNATGLAMIAYVQWLGSWATPEAIAYREAHAGAAPAAEAAP
ncbi:MAG: cbb3-type cytochrome c oxidase subunit II [Polyangiaceae bacterium]